MNTDLQAVAGELRRVWTSNATATESLGVPTDGLHVTYCMGSIDQFTAVTWQTPGGRATYMTDSNKSAGGWWHSGADGITMHESAVSRQPGPRFLCTGVAGCMLRAIILTSLEERGSASFNKTAAASNDWWRLWTLKTTGVRLYCNRKQNYNVASRARTTSYQSW